MWRKYEMLLIRCVISWPTMEAPAWEGRQVQDVHWPQDRGYKEGKLPVDVQSYEVVSLAAALKRVQEGNVTGLLHAASIPPPQPTSSSHVIVKREENLIPQFSFSCATRKERFGRKRIQSPWNWKKESLSEGGGYHWQRNVSLKCVTILFSSCIPFVAHSLTTCDALRWATP